MKGVTAMNVKYSTMPQGKGLTDMQLKDQWEQFDWKLAEKRINGLQTRITKATLEKDWNLVKRLQYLLVNSFSGKMLAVKKVTSNKGKRTSGIDGEIWIDPASKMKAALNLIAGKYKAKPLKRTYIEKPGKREKRPLSIPTMGDRAMQALLNMALSPVAEATADRCSFGFRKFRSAHDACQQLFNCLAQGKSAKWILEADIKGCFDNINHEWIMENIPIHKRILLKILKSGYVYFDTLFPTEIGTPQGGVLSPTIANMTLDGIENILAKKYYSRKNGNVDKSNCNLHKINFVRYADDFVVTTDSEEIALEIKTLITEFLKPRGLTLSEEKTKITYIDVGFDFLGWNFRKYNGKLLIKPSEKSIATIISKISDTIKKAKAWSQKNLIDELNPIITGWANYHHSVVSSAIFHKLDNIVYNMLYLWARRRHHDKSRHWTVKKYWHSIGTRNWVFAEGDKVLKHFSDVKIIRHPALKLEKNPYLNQDYFKKRNTVLKTRMRGSMGEILPPDLILKPFSLFWNA